MLFVVVECIGQSKWSFFRKQPERLANFNTMDEGTRGPWKALLLLVRMRGRTVLASVGALIIVSSLIVDPFMQQALKYTFKLDIHSKYKTSMLPSVLTWNVTGSPNIWLSHKVDPCMFFTTCPFI